jgi:hypothetical protein
MLTDEERRLKGQEFTRKALLACKPESSIRDIVYLEDDKFTYEYFLTGKFDE